MNYDAVAVGPYDLSAGVDFIEKSDGQTFPWISANIYYADNASVFSPFIIKEIGGVKIGIIGLTNPSASLPPNLHFADWQDVLPPLVQTLTKKCDHIILLSNLANADNYLIAKECPGIDMIIAADTRYGNLSPVIHHKTLITQTGSRGKYLGFIKISWGRTGGWTMDQNTISTSSTFSSRFIALTSSLPYDPHVERIVTQIKENIRDLNSINRHVITAKDQESVTGKQPIISFTGFNRCEACHQKQTAFWNTTRHARAYTSLVKISQNKNLECLPCHVTHRENLFLKPPEEASILLSLSPSMQTVGCEVCHGAGSAHADNPEKNKLIRRPSQKICLHCHTKQRDPNFDYVKKLKQIQCPAG